MISQEKINEIIQQNDIVEVIRDHIHVESKGKCLCPFHDDHTPSMSISKEKQIFKCFSCGEKGNVVHFIMKYHNISYIEAIKRLADRANIPLEINNQKQEYVNQKYINLNQEITLYAQYCLKTTPQALEYLKERQITEDSINRYKLGYVDSSENLYRYLIAKGYTQYDFDQLKLFNDLNYSYLEKRILFPITNSFGVIGFQCRSLDQNAKLRYLNTSENILFNKGNSFYGFEQAKEAIRKNKAVYFVEGNVDAIQIARLGYHNVLAVQGSQLSASQLKWIKQQGCKVYLCLDNDNAGNHATQHFYKQLKCEQIEAKIIDYSGKDPDESIKNNPDLFKEKLDKPVEFYEYYLKYAPSKENFAELQAYITNYFDFLKNENNAVMEYYFLERLSQKITIPIEQLQKQYQHSSYETQISDVVQTISDADFQQKDGKIFVNLKQKSKVDSKEEITINFDKQETVLCFDEEKVLEKRSELLYKYLKMRGAMLETTITLYNVNDDLQNVRAICDSVHSEIAKHFDKGKENYHYVAFVHYHSKHPHIHLQLYQKEPLQKYYSFSTRLVEDIQNELKQYTVKVENEEYIEKLGSPQGTTIKL